MGALQCLSLEKCYTVLCWSAMHLSPPRETGQSGWAARLIHRAGPTRSLPGCKSALSPTQMVPQISQRGSVPPAPTRVRPEALFCWIQQKPLVSLCSEPRLADVPTLRRRSRRPHPALARPASLTLLSALGTHGRAPLASRQAEPKGGKCL